MGQGFSNSDEELKIGATDKLQEKLIVDLLGKQDVEEIVERVRSMFDFGEFVVTDNRQVRNIDRYFRHRGLGPIADQLLDSHSGEAG